MDKKNDAWQQQLDAYRRMVEETAHMRDWDVNDDDFTLLPDGTRWMDRPALPVLAPSLWRQADEPRVTAAVAEYLADWFNQ